MMVGCFNRFDVFGLRDSVVVFAVMVADVEWWVGDDDDVTVVEPFDAFESVHVARLAKHGLYACPRGLRMR